jgi:hypothetical protein
LRRSRSGLPGVARYHQRMHGRIRLSSTPVTL